MEAANSRVAPVTTIMFSSVLSVAVDISVNRITRYSGGTSLSVGPQSKAERNCKRGAGRILAQPWTCSTQADGTPDYAGCRRTQRVRQAIYQHFDKEGMPDASQEHGFTRYLAK